MEEVFDEFFVDAGEEGEFFDGDEFVSGFAEGDADLLEKLAGSAASTAGDVLYVPGIEYYPCGKAVRSFHGACNLVLQYGCYIMQLW